MAVGSKRKSSFLSRIVVGGLVSVGAGALIVPALLQAQERGGAMGGAPTTMPSGGAPGDAMGAMNRALRGLNRGGISDPSKHDASLASLWELEHQSIIAKGGVPPMIARGPEADRPAKLTAYRKEMIKLIRQELDAEEALIAGDYAKAGEMVTAIVATETEGHAEFRPRRGGGGPGRGPGGAGGGAGAGSAR